MSVADYASRIRSAILETPHIVSHSLGYEDRPPVAGIIKGSATFADGTVLHFKEYLQFHPTSIRLKYAYHYAAETGSLIFRYDNARDPAARGLPTYPHHRHSRTGLEASSGPSFSEVLREAAALVKRLRG
ncbi:MAG: DUF6516 family protein [Nitrospira sp.]|nr:hypothetical protein [Nitrospira sp.]